MNKNKTTRGLKFALEIIWLITSILAIGTGIRESYLNDINAGLPFFGIAVIGIFFYISRRNQRIKSAE